jgi:hypothetical protein
MYLWEQDNDDGFIVPAKTTRFGSYFIGTSSKKLAVVTLALWIARGVTLLTCFTPSNPPSREAKLVPPPQRGRLGGGIFPKCVSPIQL